MSRKSLSAGLLLALIALAGCSSSQPQRPRARSSIRTTASVERRRGHHRHASSRSPALLRLSRTSKRPRWTASRSAASCLRTQSRRRRSHRRRTPASSPGRTRTFTKCGIPAASFCNPPRVRSRAFSRSRDGTPRAFVGSAVLKKLFGFNNGFTVYDDEMPRPGKRNEFREDPERKASVVVDRAIEWLEQETVGQAVLPVGTSLRSAYSLQSAARVCTEVQRPPIRWRNRLHGPAARTSVRAPSKRSRQRTRR